MSPQRVFLGYNLSHFISFSEQLAARIEDHRTTGNQACHLVAAPILGVAFLALINQTAGYAVALIYLVALALWCMATDVYYGLLHAVFSIATAIGQLHYGYGPQTLPYTLALFPIAGLLQLGIGHGFFERRPPNEMEGIVKGDGTRLFAILDFLCEVFPATFHFYTILCLRLGFRPELSKQVQIELQRIDSLIAKR